MPLFLAGTDGSVNQIACDDNGQLGWTQVFGQTPSQYLICDPLTGATYLLQEINLTDPNDQYLSYAPEFNARGLCYVLESPSGYLFTFGVVYGLLAAWQGSLQPPKIVYPSASSPVNPAAYTLFFTRYPVRLPATVGASGSVASYKARRVQKVFSSGASEVNFHPIGPASGPGVDQFFKAIMEHVALADLGALPPASPSPGTWAHFKLYSLAAGQVIGPNTTSGDGSFDFYYSASSGNFDRYVDDDIRWTTKSMQLAGKGTPFYTFPINFRLFVAP